MTFSQETAKMFIRGPDTFCSVPSEMHLHILVGLLAGHIARKRHLTVMRTRTDPLFPVCVEEDETSFHFLGTGWYLRQKPVGGK